MAHLDYSFAGEDLLKALENGVCMYPKLEGRFPQVAGMSFAFDPSKPPGSRVSFLSSQATLCGLYSRRHKWLISFFFEFRLATQSKSTELREHLLSKYVSSTNTLLGKKEQNLLSAIFALDCTGCIRMPRHILIQATRNIRCGEGCLSSLSSHLSFRKATRRWKSRYRDAPIER